MDEPDVTGQPAAQQPDKRLRMSKKQLRHMTTMIHSGVDPHEARLRVLNISLPREIDEEDRVPFQEYPKVMYHQKTNLAKTVQDAVEEEALGEDYGPQPVKVAPPSWREKLNEQFTKSGFRITEQHLAFLRAEGRDDISTLAGVAEFLDGMEVVQQEEFLIEAADWMPGEPAPETATPAPAPAEKKSKKK